MLLNEVNQSTISGTIGEAPRPGAVSSPCDNCRLRTKNICGSVFNDEPGRDRIRRKYRTSPARRNIYRAGEKSDGVLVICEGWAVRFVQLANGKRQILSVMLPGDLASPPHLLERSFAFSIQAVTRVTYCYFSLEEIRNRIQSSASLLDAWIEQVSAEQSRSDKQLVDLGQRAAQERIVSLVLRVMLRAEARDALQDDDFEFPLNQQQIADCTGLTPVHVCRILGALRNSGVCDVKNGHVKVLDRAELMRMGPLH